MQNKPPFYTDAELEAIMAKIKQVLPVGSVVTHCAPAGRHTVVIKHHRYFKIVNNPYFTAKGVCYGRFFFWANGAYCVDQLQNLDNANAQ